MERRDHICEFQVFRGKNHHRGTEKEERFTIFWENDIL